MNFIYRPNWYDKFKKKFIKFLGELRADNISSKNSLIIFLIAFINAGYKK